MRKKQSEFIQAQKKKLKSHTTNDAIKNSSAEEVNWNER